MNKISIINKVIPDLNSVIDLYNDANWTSYTSNPIQLENALRNSLKVWTAWDGDLLVGLARVVGDGYTIIYIQDILVLKSYQCKGLGSLLLNTILEEYQEVRQIVLLTDESEKTVKFYEKNGLTPVGKNNCVAFMK
mgnify:CR=1 FL=1